MLKVTTIEGAKALIGQTFGSGENQRVITRIEGLRLSNWSIYGHVYWKRPGGEERSISNGLQYFLAWANKAEREADRTPVYSLRQVEAFLGTVPEGTELEGFVSRVDDQITISFKVL